MDIVMPQLGETVTEGTVTAWHKKVGDRVEANEVLFEVSTDKVDTEVPAPTGGVLKEIAVEEGATVGVGVRLGVIEEEGAAAAATAPSGGATIDIVMPQLGETVTEGTVTAWHKKPGDTVGPGEVLFEVSTDKVDTEVPAPAKGVLREILVEEGETVAVGVRLGVILGEGAAVAATANNPPPAVANPAPSSGGTPAQASRPARDRAPQGARNRDGRGRPLSPAVRKLVAENNLDADTISGTGKDGRVKRDDVLAFLETGNAALAARKPAAMPAAERTEIPFNKLRKLTADHMVRSKATSPHVLQAVEADFHAVEKARAALGADWKAREGYSLTYLPFTAYAICRAMADFPNVNAHIEGETLVVFGRINLGIAVDLGFDGLVAPVVKDAGSMSLRELAGAIRDLATRARESGLSPDDMAGGTYTISNSGVFGTLITAPIINQPQVAILSTDGIRKKPVVIEGDDGDSIAIRPVGVLAQSFDHRAIDGAYSAAFLHRLREIIETTDWAQELRSS